MKLGLKLVNLFGLHQTFVRNVFQVLSLHQLELLWSALFFLGCFNVFTVLHAGPDHVKVELIWILVECPFVESLQRLLLVIKVPVEMKTFDEVGAKSK